MRSRLNLLALLAALLLVIGCQTAPRTEAGKEDLEQDAQAALSKMKANDPSIDGMIDKGHGYVIFPNAGKGALIVGGGYGRGIVYDDTGAQIGFADITQASVGAQIGGQAFSELIVFENEAALERFKNNQLTFRAGASAVIVKQGVATEAKFEDGVAVYVMPKAGAMAAAAVGGQKFTFTAASGSGQPATRPAERASARQEPAEKRTETTETEVRTDTGATETKTEIRRETD